MCSVNLWATQNSEGLPASILWQVRDMPLLSQSRPCQSHTDKTRATAHDRPHCLKLLPRPNHQKKSRAYAQEVFSQLPNTLA